MRLPTALIAASIATPALAQQTTLTVNPGDSSVSVEACVNTGINEVCQTGGSGLQGSLTIEVDDAGAPTSIAIVDLDISNTSPIVLVYDFGFLGSATFNADTFSVQYAGVGTSLPGTIIGGVYTIPAVPVVGSVSGSYSSSGIIGGTIGSGAIDQSSPEDIDLTGTLSVDPQTGDYTLTMNFNTVQSGEITTGVTVTVDGDGSLVATGPAPEDECLADVNMDGEVTPTDFGAWLAAFNAGDPAADQNQDGMVTPTDFGAWLANFNAGC